MLAVRGNVPQNGGLNHLAVDGDFRGVGRRKGETQQMSQPGLRLRIDEHLATS